jgi:hypothetical protein
MYVRDPLDAPSASPLDPPMSGPGPLSRPPYLGQDLRRSSIPRVIGILAIVFSSLGLLGSFATLVGPADDMLKFSISKETLGTFGTWMNVYVVLAVALFGVHLTAGIQSVRYARSAPLWMTIYAILAIVLIVVDMTISYSTFPKGEFGFLQKAIFEDLVYPRLGLAVLALPWPIVVLSLMNQRTARLACAARRV